MRYAILPLCMLALAGCNAHDVSVTAWSDGREMQDKSYCIVGDTQDIIPNDLEFQEFAQYVRRGLAAEGYSEAAIGNTALLVSLAYGMYGPYVTPYAYMTELTTPQYTLAAAGQAADDPPAEHAHVGGGVMHHEPGFVGGGYYGSYYNGYTSSQYVRFLHLAAYDNAGGKRGNQRWRVDAVSSGSEHDLRKLMPFMVAAAYGYVGMDTGTQKDLTISSKDARYKTVVGSK
jgi:hypothetical protein